MSSLREERIKRRILMRKREFASGLKLSSGRNYKATSPVGRPLRNCPAEEKFDGKAVGLSKWRSSRSYRVRHKK
jgi:hypothetical protein